MKVIDITTDINNDISKSNDPKLNSAKSTASIFVVNDIIDRVYTMTQDSKINLEPNSDIPNNDEVTERDVRLKSSTRPPSTTTQQQRRNHPTEDDAVLDSSDTESSSVRCSLPLEKINDNILQELSSSASNSDCNSVISEVIVNIPSVENSIVLTPVLKSSAACKKRLLCLFCDRIFVSSNLRQKHVERCHSANQLRRSSSRTPGHSKLSPSCMFCGQVDNVGNDLKKLLEHLILEHSVKYHACLNCEERFGSKESLKQHNSSVHGFEENLDDVVTDVELPLAKTTEVFKETPLIINENIITAEMTTTTTTIITPPEKKNIKKRVRKFDIDVVMEPSLPPPPQNPMIEDFEETIIANVISAAELLKQKELMEKENALKLAELEKQKTNRNTKKGKATRNNTSSTTTTNESSPRTTRRSTKTSTPVKNKPKTSKINPVPPVPDDNGIEIKEPTKSELISKIETISIKVTPCEGSPPNYEFDENFFTCVSFNIQENLLNHLDGKLHTNTEILQNHSIVSKNSKAENNSYCSNSSDNNLALTALTPVTTLLTSQIGIDAYRQIEYGSKAPKQVTRKHYVKYNFRSRKQKPSDAENQKDISKLDMWTQVAMKMRQQKVKNSLNVTPTTSDEINRRTEQQVEELNRILDTRGPFQDLHEEALNSSKQKQQNDDSNDPNSDNTNEMKTVLEDILINVFDKVPSTAENSTYENNPVVNLDKFITERLKSTEPKTNTPSKMLKSESETKSNDVECVSFNRITRSRFRNETTNEKLLENETLSYFNLTRTPSTTSQRKSIDMKSTTESLYKLGLDVKQMDKYLSEFDHEIIVSSSVELSGEWARPRIYICGACGLKISNLKLLEDHKTFIHPHVWCVHYEFVGNQSEFYPHLNIPGLGRILENEKKDVVRNWEKSGARQCSKCQKECNTLGDLHRHMLDCGGDWSWMLAKKKCKYRPFGARSRRRRVMELKRKLRVRMEGGVSSCATSSNGESTTTRGGVVERRRNRSKLEGPRPPRPSDAETIQRMLANLPPKRATRKIICLKEAGLRKPNRLVQNPKTTVVGTNRTKFKTTSQLLKSPTNNKNETIKAANQKMKQALQRNLRSRNQLAMKSNETKETVTPDRKVSPRTTRRSASNSPKNENKKIENDANTTAVNNRKPKVQKVLASKIIDSNTAMGPKSKIFSRKKTRFGETVVTRLRNKILLAQKYINSDNTERMRLTRSRGLHVSKMEDNKSTDNETKEIESTQKVKKPVVKNVEEKNVVPEEVPKTKRRLRSLKFLTKTLRSHKKITEVTENVQNTPSTSPARRSNRMRILSRIQRKLPSFNRRNDKDKNEPVTTEEPPEVVKDNKEVVPPTLPVESIPEKPSGNLENNIVVENKAEENLDPPVLEKILPPKQKTNIDYCIESVVANITGQVTYKEYAQRPAIIEDTKKSSFSLKTFTQNMRNITRKLSTNAKFTAEQFMMNPPEGWIGESSKISEKVTLGKRKRVISTQTDNPSVLDDEQQPPILFPQLPPPAPPPPPPATLKDTISDTIEEVIAKYSLDSGDDNLSLPLLTKPNKKLKIHSEPDNKCDSIPKNLSNQNFPMPILEAVGPPNELKRDSIVTIPILLPVVSHVIISTGTQINSNLLEKIMDTSINNFQLNNIVPAEKNPLLNHPSGKNFNEKDSDKNGLKSSPQTSNKEYHNYVIETPMQKLIQNGLYPVLPNTISNVAFDNIQISDAGENSTANYENLKPEEDPKTIKDKNKAKGLKKPIKKLNDCINMLKQKLMSTSSSDNLDSNQRGDILKIPTPKFNKPPIFSDPVVKKITEAPFQTAPVKNTAELSSSQCLDFSIPKNIEEIDQTSPIDLSCPHSASKLFLEPIANEVEHIIETKSIQKPISTKSKGSINFSDLPRQMELLANEAERVASSNTTLPKEINPIENVPPVITSEIQTLDNNSKLIIQQPDHPIILNVPEIESSMNTIGNIELQAQKNIEQNEIIDVENLTKERTEQKENLQKVVTSDFEKTLSHNTTIGSDLLNKKASLIQEENGLKFDSNDNLSKTIEFVSKFPDNSQQEPSFTINIPTEIINTIQIPLDTIENTTESEQASDVTDTTKNTRSLRGRRRGAAVPSRRIGTVRTRNTRKFNADEFTNVNEIEKTSGDDDSFTNITQEENRDDSGGGGGSDTSFEDIPLIKLVQTKVVENPISIEKSNESDNIDSKSEQTELDDDVKQRGSTKRGVKKDTFEPVKVDNLTEIINQVAENTTTKSDNLTETIKNVAECFTDNLTEIINRVAENTTYKSDNLTETINEVAGNKKGRKKKIDTETIESTEISIEIEPSITSEIEQKLPETIVEEQPVSSLLKVRRKPGRKPKNISESIDTSQNTSVIENSVVTNMYHSTPELKSTKPYEFGNTSTISNTITDDANIDLENELTLFTVEKISPMPKISVQDPKALLESKLEITHNISTIVIEDTKRPRLKPGRKPKKLFEQTDNQTVENILNVDVNLVQNSVETKVYKKPGRKPKQILEQVESKIEDANKNQEDSTIEISSNETSASNKSNDQSETKFEVSDTASEHPIEPTMETSEDKITTLSNKSKRPGRKPKKILEEVQSKTIDISKESSNNPEVQNTIIIEDPKNIEQPKTFEQNKSESSVVTPIEKQGDSITETISIIEDESIQNTSQTKKQPGRKSKKILAKFEPEISDNLKENPDDLVTENIPDIEDESNKNSISDKPSQLIESEHRLESFENTPVNSDTLDKNSNDPIIENTLQSKKPGRKSKKVVEQVENMNTLNEKQNDSVIENIPSLDNSSKNSGRKSKREDVENKLEEPENVPTDDNVINQNYVEDESTQLKKSGRKSKNSLEQLENKLETSDVINESLEKSTNIVPTIDNELNQNNSIENNQSELKKPGRKSKKSLEQLENKLETSDVINASLEKSTNIVLTTNNELNQNSIENNQSELKKPGRKSKKSIEQLENTVETLDIINETLEKYTNVPNTVNELSQNSIESTKSELKKSGRKSQKSLEQLENKVEISDIINENLEKSTVVPNTDNELSQNSIESNQSELKKLGRKSKKSLEQLENKLEISETINENLEKSTSVPNNNELSQKSVESIQSELKKLGRKSKKSLEQLENKLEISETINENLEKSTSVPNTDNELSEKLIESNQSELKKPGRKSKKSLKLENKLENSDIINDNLEKSTSVPNTDNEFSQNSIESNPSELKKPGRKSKKSLEQLENKLESLDTFNENLEKSTSVPNTDNELSQNSTEVNQSKLKKPGRKSKKSLELEKKPLSSNILTETLEEVISVPTIDNVVNQKSLEGNQSQLLKPGEKLLELKISDILNENLKESMNVPTIDNELNSIESKPLSKKPGRKSKKSLEQNKFECIENVEQSSTFISVPIIDNELSQSSVESKISGRKSKRSFEQLENKLEIFDVPIDSSKENTIESITATDIELNQLSVESNSIQLKKPGRKSKKSLEQVEIKSTNENIPGIDELSQHSMDSNSSKKRKSKHLSEDVEDKLETSDVLNTSETDTQHNLVETVVGTYSTRSKPGRKSKKSFIVEEQSDNKSEIVDTLNNTEKDIQNDSTVENMIEINSTRSKSGRRNKKLLDQEKPESLEQKEQSNLTLEDTVIVENEPKSEFKSTRSKLPRKSKNISDYTENNDNLNSSDELQTDIVLENVPSTESNVQESIILDTRLKSGRKSKKSESVKNSSEIIDTVIESVPENTSVVITDVVQTITNVTKTKPGRKSKKLLEDLKNKSILDISKSDSEIGTHSIPTIMSDSEDELPLAVFSKQTEKLIIEPLIVENTIEKFISTTSLENQIKQPVVIVENSIQIAKEVIESAKKSVEIEFQFKEPEIRLTQIKTKVFPIITPGDETTDDEGDVPLAQRFGISKLININPKIIETKENETIIEKTEDKKEVVEENLDKISDISIIEESTPEKDALLDLDNKKRRGRPKKKESFFDEGDYQLPRRITRRSNSTFVPSSIYENIEENKEIVQNHSENHIETEANVVLGNILMENNQNIENLDQNECKKLDKKSEKSTKIDEKLKIQSQENEFAPPDEVDSPVVVVTHNEENSLKSEAGAASILHKSKKQRKLPPIPQSVPKKCEENLEKITITFKKVSKLNSAIGLQLTDFENVQIITKPKTDTVVQPEHKSITPPKLDKPTNPAEETDEESNIPLAQRTFLQKARLIVNTDDKNVFQFKQPGLPFNRCKRRSALPPVFNAVDETTDEEADVPLAQRFGITKPPFTNPLLNSNPADETEDEDRIIPLAERLEKLRKKAAETSYTSVAAAEETEDEDRIIPLAERLAKLKQMQANKFMNIKLDIKKVPDPAEETDEECYLPLAERIAKQNPKVVESLNIKLNTKIPDPAEETDEECYLPLAERISMLNKQTWQQKLPEISKPSPLLSAIPNPADETEDEERIMPLAQRIALKKDTDVFQFKEPEIPETNFYNRRRKTLPAIFTPADETTDEEGDVPLARRFGLTKPSTFEDENFKKRKNSLEEPSSKLSIEISEQIRKRRKSVPTTVEFNEKNLSEVVDEPKIDTKTKSIDVFDFNEPDSPIGLGLDNIRQKSKKQNDLNVETPEVDAFSKLLATETIENIPKLITADFKSFHSEKQKKSPVKKVFKIRKKRRKGKLKFTNRRIKKVLSKTIVEESEIIEPPTIDTNQDLEIEEPVRPITPTIEFSDKNNDTLEKLTENIDEEGSRHSSFGDVFDNHTDVSSLSDTVAENVPEPSEAVILERHSPLLLRIKTNFKAKGKRGRPPVKKISISVDNTENYCEICNKHFCRADNLIKHKMTFTHIAKLSELEAKESAKRRLEERSEEIPTTSGEKDATLSTPDDKPTETDEDDDDVFEESSNFENDVASRDLDELAMKFIVRKNRLMDDDSIGNSDEGSTDAFNLGNGVNYPDLVTSHQPKRYRSLGERKSFDSNQSILSPDHQLDDIPQNSPIPDSIIQDEDSSHSNDIPFEIPPPEQQRPKSQNTNVIFDYLKKSSDTKESTTPTFEFITQNQFEENFTRKKLNRDEELFLECCSLLKNNSKSRKISQFEERNDVQSSSHIIENSVEAARIDDWSNSNSVASDWLSQKESASNTPFGSSALMNNSSYKFTSDNNIKDKSQNSFEEIPFKSIAVNEYMDFSNINVSGNQHSESKKESSKDKDDFSEINSLLSSSETSVSSINDEQSLISVPNEDSLNNPDLSDFCASKQDDSTVDSKKIPTKGALKIFEGIKVSIPTQEINLAEVLNSTQNKIIQIENQLNNSLDTAEGSSNDTTNKKGSDTSLKLYKNGVEVSQSILKASKNKLITSFLEKRSGSEKSFTFSEKDDEPVVSSVPKKGLANKFGNKLGLKESKKKFPKVEKKSQTPTMKAKAISKAKDIYDFEDSQDEFGGDQLNFKTYRDQKLFSPNENKEEIPVEQQDTENNLNNSDSDDDHHDYIDSFSVDESSHSSDEEDATDVFTKVELHPPKKAQTIVKGVKNENKKGMIMGRIFKHVVKSKTPEIGSPSEKAKDVNTLFDSLLGKTLEEKSNQEPPKEQSPPVEVVEQPSKNVKPAVIKTGKKPGKRTKPADSSSDDDFCLTRKPQKKINRRKKGNASTKDDNESASGINLEQEIRECIGVAGRKSQRKCTSGKQNVLVEFWSSDELSDSEKRMKENLNDESNVINIESSKDNLLVNKENDILNENIEFKTNNEIVVKQPTVENNPLNETAVNINEIKAPLNSGGGGVVKRKVIRGNGTTTGRRKPRVQMNKISRKCSKIRNKTKARGRQRKKILPNNNNTESIQQNNQNIIPKETNSLAVTRRKRSASEKLYYWSSSSDDEFEDFIEVKPIREDPDDDRPMHHGWIVGDSPKKLVTMLAQAKGKKVDAVYVKEQGKRNRVTL